MKIFTREYILNHFVNLWPNDYYLADFILSWLISHEMYYYNYNTPTCFSLCGKCTTLYCIFDFITCVANTENAVYKKKYKMLVKKLTQLGAPVILFSVKYGIK